MGGKHLKTEEHPENTFPETIGSVKKFFEWGLEELKKDIMKAKGEDTPLSNEHQTNHHSNSTKEKKNLN
jgi:hypothetical protein